MKSIKVNALLNVIRQCCSIVFPLITLPYVCRVIGADGIGKYTFSSSITNYFVLFAALGINTYAVREGAPIRDCRKKIEQFGSELFSINVISSIVAYGLFAILIFFNEKIQTYTSLLVIQSVAIVLATVGTEWVNTIYEDYLYITIRYVAIQIVCLVLILFFVKSSQDLQLYAFFVVFAASGGNVVNVFYRKKYCDIKFTLKMGLKKHIKPLLVLFVNSVAILIYVGSDITILGFFENDYIVGVYGFSARIYNIIKGVIAAAIAVVVPRIAYVGSTSNENNRDYVCKLFHSLIMFTLPIVIVLLSLSKEILFLVGGREFVAGSNSLKCLSCAMIFALCSSVFTNCVLIVNRLERKCLYSTLITALMNILLNIIFIPLYGMIAAAVTTVVAEAMNMFIQLYFSFQFVKVKRLFNKDCIAYVISGIVMFLICYCISSKNEICDTFHSLMIITISSCISLFVYVFILKLFKNRMYVEFVKSMCRLKEK